jgi:hypothetical protein
MIPFVALTIVLVVGIHAMRSLVDDKRRLPPASTPEGRRARVIVGIMLLAMVSALTLYIKNGGLTGQRSAQSIVTLVLIGSGVALISIMFQLKKEKRDK